MANPPSNRNIGFPEVTLSHFWGQLEKRHYRRRLIFIQRHFVPDKKPYEPWYCKLSAGVYQTKADKVKYKNTKIDWLPFNAPYISDNRRQQIVALMQTRMANQNLAQIQDCVRAFSVIVPSLMYWFEWNLVRMEMDRTRELFDTKLCIQVGMHILVAYEGNLVTVTTYIREVEKTDGKSDEKTDGKNRIEYNVTDPRSIQSIYPVIRYEWDEKAPKNQSLVFGLAYEPYTTILEDDTLQVNYRHGDRYYHRFGEQKLSVGGVFEFSSEKLDTYKTTLDGDFYQGFRYACCLMLYVCAGAKLLATDHYHEDISQDHHNRSLMQQGAVYICLNGLSPRLVLHGDLNKNQMHLNNFYDLLTDVEGKPLKQDIIKKLRTYTRPVIFLGPIDSEYNTIAYNINIVKLKTENGRPTILDFNVPMDARIVAIEDYEAGIAEIKARINYEMLHDSVVTNHETQFSAPGFEMAKKILNPNELRSFNTPSASAYSHISALGHTKQAPKEFNISKVTDLGNPKYPDPKNPDKLFKQFWTKQSQSNSNDFRLSPPPMYPPLNTITNLDNKEYNYLPSSGHDLDLNKLYKWNDNDRQPYLAYGAYKYIYKEEEWLGYHYVRVTTPTDHTSSKNIRGQFSINESLEIVGEEVCRIGVDGWIWKKVSVPIFKEKNWYFHKYEEPSLLATPQPVARPTWVRPSRPQTPPPQQPRATRPGLFGSKGLKKELEDKEHRRGQK